jgi:uncharacterized protein YndB with AHSA1/START domain
MLEAELDARVGGRFRFVDRRAGEDVEHTGEYLEIDRPRRLVFRFGLPKYSDAFDRVVIELVPAAGGGCVVRLTHEMGPEWAAARRQAEAGWRGILDAAARVLEDTHPGQALGVVEAGFEWSFERQLPCAPERAFRALTEPAMLAGWFPFEIQGRRELGAALRYVCQSGEQPPEEGIITEYEPPRVLAHTWGDQAFRWELSPSGTGSRLLLTNTFSRAMKAERDETDGWEHCQVALESQLGALEQYLGRD